MRIFEVCKAELTSTHVDVRPDIPLSPGDIRLQIDSLALTANNVTYAAFGEAFNYWKIFPGSSPDLGCVPAWGFAIIVESTQPALMSDESLYGYWPMANQAVLEINDVGHAGFAEASPHRAGLHDLYNHYTR